MQYMTFRRRTDPQSQVRFTPTEELRHSSIAARWCVEQRYCTGRRPPRCSNNWFWKTVFKITYKPLLYRPKGRCTIVTVYNYFIMCSKCFCFVFVWCRCMAINLSVQHNGGFLPGIILLTLCYYHRGTRFNVMKRFFVFAAYDPT